MSECLRLGETQLREDSDTLASTVAPSLSRKIHVQLLSVNDSRQARRKSLGTTVHSGQFESTDYWLMQKR